MGLFAWNRKNIEKYQYSCHTYSKGVGDDNEGSPGLCVLFHHKPAENIEKFDYGNQVVSCISILSYWYEDYSGEEVGYRHNEGWHKKNLHALLSSNLDSALNFFIS